jgi:tape measure domain-containing protein
MIVRELVTLLSYKKGNEAPLKEYTNALKDVARLAAEFFAITAGVEMVRKVTELSDEWATVAGRVSNVVDGLDEQHRVLDALQLQAEKTGQAYESVGSLFAQINLTGAALGYTTDQVLGLTSAISELVTLGGGTAAGAKRGMVQIEEMFSIGTIQMQHLRALLIDIPGAVDVLSTSLEGGRKKFMEMVHDGTMTSKMFGDLFLKSADEIERRFGRMPLTFGRAFQTVRNFFGRLIADIGEATAVWTTLAQYIISSSKGIIDSFRWLERVTGGWGNALKAALIAFMALMGPRTLAMVFRMISALRSITIVTIAMAAPWYLLVGLIGLALLALEDLSSWWAGKDTLFGRAFGDVKEWQGAIDAWKKYFMDAIQEVMDFLDRIGTALGFKGYFARSLDRNLSDPGSPAMDDLLEQKRRYDATHDWLGREITPPPPEPATSPTPLVAPIPMDAVPVPDTVRQPGLLRELPRGVSPLLIEPQIPLSSLVPPAAMAPPNITRTTNNDIRAPVTVNVTSASDTPQAIGAAAGEGARNGTLDSWARALGTAAPQTEFGLAY